MLTNWVELGQNKCEEYLLKWPGVKYLSFNFEETNPFYKWAKVTMTKDPIQERIALFQFDFPNLFHEQEKRCCLWDDFEEN